MAARKMPARRKDGRFKKSGAKKTSGTRKRRTSGTRKRASRSNPPKARAKTRTRTKVVTKWRTRKAPAKRRAPARRSRRNPPMDPRLAAVLTGAAAGGAAVAMYKQPWLTNKFVKELAVPGLAVLAGLMMPKGKQWDAPRYSALGYGIGNLATAAILWALAKFTASAANPPATGRRIVHRRVAATPVEARRAGTRKRVVLPMSAPAAYSA